MRDLIRQQPKHPEMLFYLGFALLVQGKPVEVEAVFRQVTALKPNDSQAYFFLGLALDLQGKPTEAEAVYRKTIALKPDDSQAYCFLGLALDHQGKPTEAEAACRKAIALKPDEALAFCGLGYALNGQGRFTESLAAYRRGHELGSKQPGWRYSSHNGLRYAERNAVLADKLPAILRGEALSANPGEAVVLASMCQQPYKKHYAASARLYADAFTADPKLTADVQQGHRYNAACSATLAAAGQGEDARLLPDKVAAMFRRWALHWLRDDLTAYAKLAQRNNPAANKTIQQRLAHWRSDPDLASLRDPQALERLPKNERAAWEALWRDVDQLAARRSKR